MEPALTVLLSMCCPPDIDRPADGLRRAARVMPQRLAATVPFCSLSRAHAQATDEAAASISGSAWWPVLLLAFTAALVAAIFWNRRLAHEKRERRRLEQRLADLGGRLSIGLFEARAFPDGQVRLLYSNKAIREMLRIDDDRATINLDDQIFTSYVHREDETRVRATIKRSIESLEPIDDAFRYKTAAGDYRWMQADVAVRVMDDGGVIWTGSVRDLNAERELQAEIRHLKASKDYFFAAASHELRTPVHTIGLSLERLALADEPIDRLALESASQACASLRTLLDELLELARVQPGELVLNRARFSLGELLDALAADFRDAYKRKSLELRMSIDPAVPDTLNADSRRLRQVLTNLLMNALQFSDSGVVSLTVSVVDPRTSSSSQTGSYMLEFAVSDHGRGLAADQLDRVFEPFVSNQAIASDALFRSRAEQGEPVVGSTGTGLGLAICRRIIEQMDGRIWLESMPERGTVARFRIPQQRVKLLPARPGPARLTSQDGSGLRSGAHHLKRRRVLLVDDDKLSRTLMSNLLISEGYLVTEAGSGRDALNRFARGRFDAIVTDLRMPGMDGETLAARIRELCRHKTVSAEITAACDNHENPGLTDCPRLIALTASLGGGDVSRQGEELFDSRLQKPVGVDELVEQLEA